MCSGPSNSLRPRTMTDRRPATAHFRSCLTPSWASDDDRRLLLGLVNDTANQTAELSFQTEVDEIEFLTDTEDNNDATEEAT